MSADLPEVPEAAIATRYLAEMQAVLESLSDLAPGSVQSVDDRFGLLIQTVTKFATMAGTAITALETENLKLRVRLDRGGILPLNEG